jgi:hypothetical protein
MVQKYQVQISENLNKVFVKMSILIYERFRKGSKELFL